MDIGRIITEVQSLGVGLPRDTLRRNGGAGPAEAGSLVIGGYPVSVPTVSPFVSRSPYRVDYEGDQAFLYKSKKPLVPVNLIPRPQFYDARTPEGIPFSHIALLHGRDCLATSVLQTCVHWNQASRCRFCGIQLSLQNHQTLAAKTPAQLARVARAAQSWDGIAHVVLTTGNAHPPGSEIHDLTGAAAAIKQSTGLPIHVQFTPPANLDAMDELKEAGVDTVGIHVESLDPEVLARVAPIKAALGGNRYEEAWKRAVEIFGPNQVSSFLIAGLGEKPASLVDGSAFLADLGVFPFVVPLRPIPGSLLENLLPPDPHTLDRVYRKVADILAQKGLHSSSSLAGCVRCGACSALGAYESGVQNLICHWARTSRERDEAFQIRREVFVEEQGLFEVSDLDEHDPVSIHLVARQNGCIVGTVRVFREASGNGNWMGGRLAVRGDYRTTGAGERLVREAVTCVKGQGCTRFRARIQENNVPFFKALGWKPVGVLEPYRGRAHQLMEADLNHPGLGVIEETNI